MLRLRGRQMSMTVNFEFPDFLNSFVVWGFREMLTR